MRLIDVPSSLGLLGFVVVAIPFMLPLFGADAVGQSGPTNQTPTGQTQAVQTNTQTFTKDLPGCHAKPNPSQCVSIHLAYAEIVSAPTPKAKAAMDGEIRDLILTPLEKGKAPATADEFASQIITHYQDWVRHGGDPKIPWAVTRSLDVVYNSPNVLCLKYTQSVELGKGHPAKSTVYMNFRPRDGRVLQIPDLIEESQLDKFTDAARKRYTQEAAPVRSTDSPNEDESGDEFALPTNFAIEADGIRFRYDDEQIDPKSHGTPEFLVPYSLVRPYLKPDVKLP
jgi:Protein of unknown function (DUF3298)